MLRTTSTPNTKSHRFVVLSHGKIRDAAAKDTNIKELTELIVANHTALSGQILNYVDGGLQTRSIHFAFRYETMA